MPKKIRYRKVQRGTLKGRSKGAREVYFGEFGLQAIDPGWVTAQQIESVRVTLTRKLKKVGQVFLRVFPDKPVTKKPAETRMGKGKGGVDYYMTPVRAGTVMFEMDGVSAEVAQEAFRLAAYKLPVKTKVITRE